MDIRVGESVTLRKPRGGRVMGTIRRHGLWNYEARAADGSRIVANRRVREAAGRFVFETYEDALGALRYYRA